jgi:hypothetical protein
MVSVAYILVSYNFFDSETLLVKTLTRVLSFYSPQKTSTMYSVGINGCNPCTNWYCVYLIVTLYAIMYENIIDRCSSQFVLLSLINLVNNVLSTLLVDSS